MKSIYRIIFIISLPVLLLINDYSILNSGQLDLGEDVSFDYRYITRKDTVISSEFLQRIRLYLNGYLTNGIEIGATLHSAGVMNSTETIVVYDGAQIQNLNPYFENAYIKINNYYDYPLSVSIGILSLNWGNGILVNDNYLGLPAVLAEYKAPWDI